MGRTQADDRNQDSPNKLTTVMNMVLQTPHRIPEWAKITRRENVSDSSAAPHTYSPLTDVPDIYTHLGHAAQYGKGRRNGRTIRMIVLHTTESDSFAGAMTFDAWRPQTVSATAIVGAGGYIGADVPEADRPWTNGRWNDESLTMEICGRAAWSETVWSKRLMQIKAIEDLLFDWCVRYDLTGTWLTSDHVAFGASRKGRAPVQGSVTGITDHLEANLAAIKLGHPKEKYGHHDVGEGLRAVLFETILPNLQLRLTGSEPSLPIQPSDTSPIKETPMITQFVTDKGLNNAVFALDSGKWTPWLGRTEGAPHIVVDHPLLRARILSDQGAAGSAAWCKYVGKSLASLITQK
jgi:hypothetical protein